MEVLHEELRNVKAFTSQTPTATPTNEIEIMVPEPDPSNANTKPVTVTQPTFAANLIFIIKSEKLPNPPMFDRNWNDLRPFVTKLRFKLLINYN